MISRSVEIQQNPSLSELWDGGWPQTLSEFEAFTGVFQERLYRFIYYRLKNPQDAEDVLQKVLLKAYRRRIQLQKVKTQAGSYLFRMAANACIDHHRKQKRVSHISIDDPAHNLQIPYDLRTRRCGELDRIDSLLNHIPAKQAEVIRLRVMDSLAFSEIAQILNCFETTARTRYRYGVRKLRQIIRKEEIDP